MRVVEVPSDMDQNDPVTIGAPSNELRPIIARRLPHISFYDDIFDVRSASADAMASSTPLAMNVMRYPEVS